MTLNKNIEFLYFRHVTRNGQHHQWRRRPVNKKRKNIIEWYIKYCFYTSNYMKSTSQEQTRRHLAKVSVLLYIKMLNIQIKNIKEIYILQSLINNLQHFLKSCQIAHCIQFPHLGVEPATILLTVSTLFQTYNSK